MSTPYAQPAGKDLTGKPDQQSESTSKKAIVSLLFGIISIVFAFLSGIIAIIFGILALSDMSKHGARLKGKAMAITGIVLGALGCLWTIPLILVALLMPAITQVRSAAQRVTTMNSMRQICLAMHNYQSAYQVMPLASQHQDSQLSWRVHLLPFLEENELYDQFHLDEPWDSPHNLTLVNQMPVCYQSLSVELAPGETNYLIPVTVPDSFSDWRKYRSMFVAGEVGPSFEQIRDGSSNTIMLLEVDPAAAVPWTKPNADWVYEPDDPMRYLGNVRPRLILAGFADGSVQPISTDTFPDHFNGMITCDAGDTAF